MGENYQKLFKRREELTIMKKSISTGLFLLVIALFISAPMVNAEKFEWDFAVDDGNIGSETFTVNKDNYFVQLTVEVHNGGPVNIFILDEPAWTLWDSGNGEVVAAYVGASNISSGSKITIEGYLGLANLTHTDYTTFPVGNTTTVNSSVTVLGINVYYLVVDNRDGASFASVYVSILTTVNTQTILVTLSALVFIAILAARGRKWKKSPF